MATLQEALDATEVGEAKIIGILQSQSQGLKDLAQQLADAIAAGGNTAVVQAVADKMMADAATMEAAANAAQPPSA
jgi:low affinity Fe/Cu permease